MPETEITRQPQLIEPANVLKQLFRPFEYSLGYISETRNYKVKT